MESSTDSGLQSKSSSTNGSPTAENPPIVNAMQPVVAATATTVQAMDTTSTAATGQITMAQVSVPQAFVMASQSTTTTDQTQSAQLMMQPPMSVPLMMPPYQMILPTQGIVDQHGQLIQQQAAVTEARGSPAPGSPAVDGKTSSRSATPQQQATALYQQPHLVQLKDGQIVKSDNEAVASPVRHGSVGSGGSPAPPNSLGSSPLPQLMTDGMHPPHVVQNFPAGMNLVQNAVRSTPPPEPPKEEKVDISKLKPPKKPLTPYMRFSKAIWQQVKAADSPLNLLSSFSSQIWQQVKAANSSMSVCEIGATIGRMWRELADTEKQKYNEDFVADKISYDVELQNYLKITGLQASDLVKNRPKKKVSAKSEESKAKKQASRPVPSPQSTPPVETTVVQQVPAGQHLVGVQSMVHPSLNGPVSIHNSPGATAGIPQQVLSGALSGLPHFSQVWTGQQGANIISQGMHATGQEQVIVQQGANGQPQQVLINTLGLPPGTVVNGSTGQATGENANVISHPILIQPTGEQATQLFSTEGHEGQKDGEHATTSQAQPAQLLGWHQVMSANPNDLQHQQNVLNLINMAAAQSGVQPDQLTQAAQIAGLQPATGLPLNIQQNVVNVSATATDSNSESQTTTALDPSHHHASNTSNTVLVDQNGAAVVQTVSNGPNCSTAQSQAVVTVPTAHNLYNSYGFNPWSGFPQQIVQAATATGEATQEGITTTDGTTITQGGIQVVYNRESILETELQHLRSALSEKTKEVQRLTQDLEKAYSIIEQLKQQNPTAVIHLPAPQEPQVMETVTTQAVTTT